ncbi:ABC transporter permease [Reinekea blandensis]|uniref:Putative ABC transporter, permease protein n=1 Tax=Reinekea blandensis MED297 TaxID=314283 RepID=A4BC49_9GAMM|nr:ABC transporter permease [Reinekea blandensis]EAR10534.1 putative ABC transporter, permease protein [Reinekea sp. MED297] [Reinekea blandensis MED297]
MAILWEALRSALRAIAVSKMRSFLTSLGIIIGVASIIAVVSLVQGLEESITSQFEGYGSNSLFIQQRRDNYGRLIGDLTDDDLLKLKGIDGISAISPQTFVFEYSGVQYEGEQHSADVVGVMPDYAEMDSSYPELGRFITTTDADSRKKVAVIGPKVRDELGMPENPIGEFIQYGPHWLKVIGVLESKGQMMGQDLDNYVYIPYPTAVGIMGYQQQPFVIFVVRVEDVNRIDSITERVEQTLRRNHGLKPGDDNDFMIQSADQVLQSIGQITQVITWVFGGIVGISLLVGGIGIMNIMLVSVTERTREVGICKALGATRADILLQFLLEAVIISLIGGIVGLGLGFAIGAGVAGMIPNFPPSEVPAWAVFLALGFSSGVGIVFGILPAAKAARLDPIDALRYE